MNRIVILGATSGIGLEIAKLYIAAGWQVGAAGRRTENLEALRAAAPDRVKIRSIDITAPEAEELLLRLPIWAAATCCCIARASATTTRSSTPHGKSQRRKLIP